MMTKQLLVDATEDLLRCFLLTVPLLLLILGISGNFLVLRILAKKAFQKNILTVIFQALAVADLLVLSVGMMRHFVFGLTNVDFRLISPNWCWYHTWVVYSLTSTANWIIVLLTLTRILFLKYPLKIHSCCSRNILLQLLVGLLCLNFAYYYTVFHVYLYFIPDENEGAQLAYCGPISSEGDIHYYFLIFVYVCIPCLVLWTMNVLIYFLHKKIMQRHRDILVQRFNSLRRNTFAAFGIITRGSRRFTVSIVSWRRKSSNESTGSKKRSSEKVIYQRHAKGTNIDSVKPVLVRKSNEDLNDTLPATTLAHHDKPETETAVPQFLDVQGTSEHDILKKFEAHRRARRLEREEGPTNRQIFGTNVDTGQVKPRHNDGGKKTNLIMGNNKMLDKAGNTRASIELDECDKRSQHTDDSKTQDRPPASTLNERLPEALLSPHLNPSIESKSRLSRASGSTRYKGSYFSQIAHSSSALSGSEKHVVSLLVFSCILFITLNGPWSGYFILDQTLIDHYDDYRSDFSKAQWKVAEHVTNVLVFSNNALNFLVYTVFGSRFREEFRNSLRSVKRFFGIRRDSYG